MTRAHEKGRNWATEQAKREAAHRNVDPCIILAEMLERAKQAGDAEQIKAILQAQKFLGCRNVRQRRGN